MTENSEPLLTPVEAAHFLGITQELLFAYARYAPKTSLNETRRLRAVQRNGQTYFLRSELQSFDDYLREPWSRNASNRALVPTYVIDHLKVESGGQCARCGRGFKLETAHVIEYAKSLSHHHHNLIRLCSLCHEEFDTKKILPADEIVSLKARLIEQTRKRLFNQFGGQAIAGLAPPSATEIFVGRDRESHLILDGLANRRVVCIKGPGGIGKTQLALHVLGELDLKIRVLWVEIEPFGAIADLELFLASALAEPGSYGEAGSIPEKLEVNVDLVVFDGIEALAATQLDKFEDFLSQLIAKTQSPKFLITSQVELLSVNGIFNIDIPPLPAEASLQIICKVVGERMDSPTLNDVTALKRLVQFSEGHPLSLRIIANLLRYFKSAQVVVDRIKSFGVHALANPTRRQQTKESSLEACFSLAYSLLQPSERRLLFLLSHCPAGCISELFSDEGSFGIQDSQRAVAELACWHLINVDTSAWPFPRLRAMSPVRSFARRAFEIDDAKIAEALFYELASVLVIQAAAIDDRYTSDGDVGLGTRRMSQEFPNFSYIFDESVRLASTNHAYLRIVCSLAFSLQVFCFVTGHSRRGLQIMRAGAEAATKEGQLGLASSLLLQQVCFAQREGDHELVTTTIDEICALPNDAFDPEHSGNVAFACGLLSKDEGRLDEALTYYETACEQYLRSRGVGGLDADESKRAPSNPRMFALALMERARIYEHTNRQTEAIETYSASLLVMEQIHDRVNEGTVLHQMGNCYAGLREHANAYDAYVRAAHCFDELGAAIHLSNSLGELGYVLIDFDPEQRLTKDLPEELLDAGLADVFLECAERFRSDQNPLPAQACIGVLRKLFGITSLISFTTHTPLLESYAVVLRERLVRPLAGRRSINEKYDFEERLAIMHLDVMTALMGSLSTYQNSAGSMPVTIEEIGYFANLCYQQLDWGWKVFRLFDWLAAYMARCHDLASLSASQLQDAAIEAATTGKPFHLQQ